LGGWKGLTLFIPKNATIFWGWKGLTLSIPKMLQFLGLERVDPFHPKKCYNFLGKNSKIFWGWKGLTLSNPKKIVAYEERN
jgi:hypothetical protein